MKYCEEKKEEKKQKKRDKKSEEDDDNIESEKEDKSKSSHEKKKQKIHDVEKMETHLEYTNLTMNWVPLQMQMLPTDLDEEWLSRKNQSNVESESKTADQTGHVEGSSSTDNGSYQGIQPLACYLPHADIYALPYVLPF